MDASAAAVRLPDLYGVRTDRDLLLARTAAPRFRTWWGAFLAGCRTAVPPTLPPQEDGAARHAAVTALFGRAEEVALAAALTEDADLGRRAAALMAVGLADPAPWMGPAHQRHYPDLHADLILAERCKRVAAALSWAGPWWRDSEIAQAREALRERGAAVICRDAERGAWWGNGTNSNWTAVLNSGLGLAALALDDGEDTEIALWLERVVDVARAMLDLAAKEGAGVEGVGYWVYCFTSLFELAEALRVADDGFLASHRFWRRGVEFPLYQTLPDLSGWVNLGDCRYPGLSGSPLFYALASRYGNGKAQWLANRISGDPPTSRVGWRDLLWCNPDAVEEPPDGLPTARLFRTVHLAALRSDWSPQAVQVILKGGSNAWSHCHLDLNSILVNAGGDRLAVDPGPWPYTDDYWTSVEPPVSTAWHNTLTVDGADQRQPPRYRLSFDLAESGDAWCRLGGFSDDGLVATVCGDATRAYADTLKRFARRVWLRRPGLVVIHDTVRTNGAKVQRHLQWLLHAVCPMEPTAGGGIVIRGAAHDLWVTPVLPVGFRAKRLPDRCAPPCVDVAPVHAWALRPPWHHLWNVSPERSPYPQWDPYGTPGLYGRDYRFLVVLEVAAQGASPLWTPTLADAGRTLRLTSIHDGTQWTVELGE